MKILHITAHLGGGIGSAYLGLGNCGVEQTIMLLEKPEKTSIIERVSQAGFRVIVCHEKNELINELKSSDVVVFSWWHHPLLTRLMAEFPEVSIRAVLWVHVSGNYFPVLNTNFLQRFAHVCFATPYSQSLPEVKRLGNEWITNHTSIVYGLGNLERFHSIIRKDHKHFHIGYVGTLSYNKMNPDFVKYCAHVDIPDCKFIMIGDDTNKELILQEASRYGIEDKFIFKGFVDNVQNVLSEIDVFGYLLNSKHYGATENALLEALAAGIPAVALHNGVESCILENGKYGFIVNSPEEYGKQIRNIYENYEEIYNSSVQVKQEILKRYQMEDNRKRFINGCRKCLEYKKEMISFSELLGKTPSEWFLSGVGKETVYFSENRLQEMDDIFRDNSKCTPKHYKRYFGYDERLTQWANQLQ